MARPLRLEFAGALYHLTARGNARAEIFADNRDRELFLELLGKEILQQAWHCYADCLMGNHYHLLIGTPEPNLVAGMRRLNGVYTQAFNCRHGRVGHVFQGRYKSILVDKDSYGLELSRCIVLNPARAWMVKRAEGWLWSSYRSTVGLAAAVLAGQEVGAWQPERQRPVRAYKQFVEQGHGPSFTLAKLRAQIWLGNEAFLDRMERWPRTSQPNVPRALRAPGH